MLLNQLRKKRIESIVSSVILIVLILIAAVIYKKQSIADISRYGINANAVEDTITQSPKPQGAADIDSLLPTDFDVLSAAQNYTEDNLYEKINGKASLYTESGFAKLSTLRYVNKADSTLWFELYIYDMSTTKNAFSVYSLQIRADSKFSSEKNTYTTKNAIFFAHGRFYVEMIGSKESGRLFAAMTEIGAKIRKNFAVESKERIEDLEFFPRTNQLPGSASLYLANAFGFEGLNDTFTSKYKMDNEVIIAFLSKRIDSKEAETLAQNYRSFLIENGAIAKSSEHKNLQNKVLGFYGTTEIVFSVGEFVGGIHEAQTQPAAEKIALMLIEGLEKVSKKEKSGPQ